MNVSRWILENFFLQNQGDLFPDVLRIMSDLILGYSDQHLRDIGSFQPYNMMDTNGLTKELNNKLLGWQFVAQMIREHQPKIVHNFGDVVQVTEQQSCQVLYGMALAHQVVLQACRDVGAIHSFHPGNHDILNEHMNITNVHILKPYYDQCFFEPGFFNVGDFRVGVVPYSSNTGKAVHDLLASDRSADVTFTHQDFQNCIYESGLKSESNLDPTIYKKPIISGDIHVAQDVGKVHYVGSLLQDRFNQDSLDRVGGVLLMDMHTQAVRRIPNSLSRHYVRVRDLQKGLEIDPSKAVLQIITSKSNEEIEEMFRGYEYWRVSEIKTKTDSETIYQEFHMSDPLDILRGYVTEDNPGALSELEEVMK